MRAHATRCNSHPYCDGPAALANRAQEHLAALGERIDFSGLPEDERIKKTLEAINARVPILYQPTFRVRHMFGPTEVDILGIPDFMILDSDSYIIRDAKMARRIDEENHPEILLQVQLYGWLFG